MNIRSLLTQGAVLIVAYAVALSSAQAQTWTMKQSEDSMTDAKTAIALRGGTGKNKYDNHITLAIRCKGSDWRVYVNWGQYVSRDSIAVMSRFDDEKPQKNTWAVSNDFETTIHPRTRDAIASIKTSNVLYIRITPYASDTLNVSFNLTGSSETIEAMRSYCTG